MRIDGWHGWVGTVTGVALATVTVLPLAGLAVWALARRRRATGTPGAWRRSLAEVGIVYGTVPWVWMTMLPDHRAGVRPDRVSLGCSVLVEVAQYVLRLGRVSSVDDVLLNTAGAGLAALASRHWWRASR